MSNNTDFSLQKIESLTQRAKPRWLAWLAARTSDDLTDAPHCLSLIPSADNLQHLFTAFCFSPFVADSLEKLVPDLEKEWPLAFMAEPFDWVSLELKLAEALKSTSQEPQAKKVLRQWRRHLMSIVAIRHLSGITNIEQDYSDISNIADLFLRQAYQWLMPQMCSQWGQPLTSNGTLQNLLVVAMGKYGGKELNFSSDIDLIFYYQEDGATKLQESLVEKSLRTAEQSYGRSLEHQAFFNRLGQRFIALIGDVSADGLVYRVDMRLRPYGEGGPLAMSFAAAEDYYQEQGREWERFAMVKARVVIGTEAEKNAFYGLIKPFVFRRYIDYGVLDAIREIKVLISNQVNLKQMESNIKLGRGGIREAEFVVQALQLIRGGRQPELQHRGFLLALLALKDEQLLPESACNTIKAAYLFLRKTEHILQQMYDQQTQILPSSAEEKNTLAAAMGLPDYSVFMGLLNKHQQEIHQEFDALFALQSHSSGAEQSVEKIPLEQLQATALAPWLTQLTEDQVVKVESLLSSFVQSTTCQNLSERGKHRLSVLLPQLLLHLNSVANPDVTFTRVLDLIRAIHKRTAYLVLLAENPPILEQMVKLSSQSRWISERLVEFPLLLDELLYTNSSYSPLEIEDLQQELRRQLLRIEPDDEEQQQEQLRVFKQTNELRVAAACISNAMDIRKSSRLLSSIAESIIGAVMHIAWGTMCRRHGVPRIENASYECLSGFAVVAYGKLGGEELGFGSDLDLVFLYQSNPDAKTQGERSISHAQFFTRLAQRMIHMLNIRTLSGVLYDVDTRLRPSGNSGLLVSHNEAFADYQNHDAWTWEHQALVRAKGICGDSELVNWFEDQRVNVLRRTRDPHELSANVLDMRRKMRANLDKSTAEWMDIKQGLGGIVDIEFLVQYLVLKNAAQFAESFWSSRTTLLLSQLQDVGVITSATKSALIDAYRYYRKLSNRLVLMGEEKRLLNSELELPALAVIEIWEQTFSC